MKKIIRSLSNLPRINLIILIIGIAILFFSGYSAYHTYKDINISKAIRVHECAVYDRICTPITYKYDGALRVIIILNNGTHFFDEDLKKDYKKYVKNFTKNKPNIDLNKKIRNNKSFYTPAIAAEVKKNSQYKLYLSFEDKDGFQIKRIKIDFSSAKASLVNEDFDVWGLSFEIKEIMTIEDYKKIDAIDYNWSSGFQAFIDGL